MRRVTDADELLDGPLDDAAALRGNLRDLARINRRLGGVAPVHRRDRRPRRRPDAADILDVGTGGADIPLALLERGPTGRRWRSPASTAGRRSWPRPPSDPRLTATPGPVAPRRRRPPAVPDDAFDVVHASLVVHHLEPADASALLREMARVARLGVVVNDLVRGRLAWLGAWA